MSAAAKCLQVMLALFNMLFLVFGILVCVSGGYVFSADEVTDEQRTTSIALLVIGGLSIVIGLFGTCGAFCRSRGLLLTYAVLVILLILAQCIAGGLSISASQDQGRMAQYSDRLWTNMNNDLRNQFQKTNNCCGYNILMDRPGDQCPANVGVVIPCRSQFQDFVTRGFQMAGVYSFVAVVCELVAVTIAFILAFDERKRLQGYGRGW